MHWIPTPERWNQEKKSIALGSNAGALEPGKKSIAIGSNAVALEPGKKEFKIIHNPEPRTEPK